MDIKTFYNERQTKLQEFQNEYNELKIQYKNSLQQYLEDSSKLQSVLDVNKQLNDLITEFIGKSGSQFDEQTINDLTNDILLYQQQYKELKNSKNSNEKAQQILNSETITLNDLKYKYNIFLGIFIVCILIIIYYIFITPKQSILVSLKSQPLPMM
jgi:predicted nuclease with TOPRIM domain